MTTTIQARAARLVALGLPAVLLCCDLGTGPGRTFCVKAYPVYAAAPAACTSQPSSRTPTSAFPVTVKRGGPSTAVVLEIVVEEGAPGTATLHVPAITLDGQVAGIVEDDETGSEQAVAFELIVLP